MQSEYDESLPMRDVVESYMLWNTADGNGNPARYITEEYDYLNGIFDLTRSLKKYAEKGQYSRISVTKGSKQYKPRIEVPVLLRDIIINRTSSLEYWRSLLGDCAYSPMIEAYIKLSKEWSNKISWSRGDYVNLGGDDVYVRGINGFLDELYSVLHDPKTIRSMHNHVRSAKKNYYAVCDFVGNMFRKHARVLVIRLDLGYRKYDPSKGLNTQGLLLTGRLTHDHAKRHRERFLKSLKHRYRKGWVGYVWKLEYTYQKGFHYHMFIFLDGNAHRQDVTLAQEMGEIWKQTITKGMGLYFNCNADKHRYGSLNGVGMVHHETFQKINNLKRAIGYLVKIDELVRAQTPYNHRIFGKSEMPEVPILPRGRKRSLIENIMETAFKNGVNVKNLQRGLTSTGLKRV